MKSAYTCLQYFMDISWSQQLVLNNNKNGNMGNGNTWVV
jgi:hypothetical protein